MHLPGSRSEFSVLYSPAQSAKRIWLPSISVSRHRIKRHVCCTTNHYVHQTSINDPLQRVLACRLHLRPSRTIAQVLAKIFPTPGQANSAAAAWRQGETQVSCKTDNTSHYARNCDIVPTCTFGRYARSTQAAVRAQARRGPCQTSCAALHMAQWHRAP